MALRPYDRPWRFWIDNAIPYPPARESIYFIIRMFFFAFDILRYVKIVRDIVWYWAIHSPRAGWIYLGPFSRFQKACLPPLFELTYSFPQIFPAQQHGTFKKSGGNTNYISLFLSFNIWSSLPMCTLMVSPVGAEIRGTEIEIRHDSVTNMGTTRSFPLKLFAYLPISFSFFSSHQVRHIIDQSLSLSILQYIRKLEIPTQNNNPCLPPSPVGENLPFAVSCFPRIVEIL